MEGREQKHQSIAKYAENTTHQNRWPLIFRHEFIQLIYLHEHGFDNVRYNKRSVSYVPSVDDSCCLKCCLKLTMETKKCRFCDNCISLRTAVWRRWNMP